MKKAKRVFIYVTVFFCLLTLAIVAIMNIRGNNETESYLEQSIKYQLISISIAAREILDIDAFVSYNSVEDAESDPNYQVTLAKLRALCDNVGAEYIYALKELDGAYYFVFDTDTEDEEIFIEYELSDVHVEAFAGHEAANVMNVDDLYGSFNTGAVPIYKDGQIVGVISTDIQDQYLEACMDTNRANSTVMLSLVAIIMLIMLLVVNRLITQVNKMQTKLERLAHYDNVTGLPNRQYLFDYLQGIINADRNANFAILFIDLDNFKQVNDSAGHDAGDEVLRAVGKFLENFGENSMAFRPVPGKLNISARIGGDEFLQVVSGVSTEQEAQDVVDHLLRDFKEFSHTNRYIEKYQVGFSIGISLYPFHSNDPHVLIKYADIAMYHAKQSGKNCGFVYDDEMSQRPEK